MWSAALQRGARPRLCRLFAAVPGPLVAAYDARTASAGLSRSPAQLRCLERLESVLSDFAQPGRGGGQRAAAARGVYIYGEPGAGKTMMLDMFHDAALAAGVPSRRTHFHDFMLDVNRELHRIRCKSGGVADPLARVAESFLEASPLLCFDECHVLNVGDAMIMRAFFERLFAAGGTVVATSNLAPDKLYSSGINREVFQPFIDAVLRHCDPLEVETRQDFRLAQSQELAATDAARGFFWPLGDEASARLAQALVEIRGCEEPPMACEIPVPMGRVLPCHSAWLEGVRVAQFSYQELCEANVGTYDYVAVSDAFDVIVLTEVPRFREADENAARRFASLVDVLYDRHKRLLCTIDAPPKEIFAAIRSQYSGGIDDDLIAASEAKSAISVPTHGGSSGRHVSAFRLPNAPMQYSESGGYGVAAGSAQDSAQQQPQQEDAWVEWSATGLKDASMFDLTCHTNAQRHDRLLPLLRCESRLEEMSFMR